MKSSHLLHSLYLGNVWHIYSIEKYNKAYIWKVEMKTINGSVRKSMYVHRKLNKNEKA